MAVSVGLLLACAACLTVGALGWGVPEFPVGFTLPPMGDKDDMYSAHSGVDLEVTATSVFSDLWLHRTDWWGAYCRPGEDGAAPLCDYDRAPHGYWTNNGVVRRDDGYIASLNYAGGTDWNEACVDIGFGGAFVEAGQYVFLFSGSATRSWRLDAALVESGAGRDVIEVTPAEGVRLCLTEVDEADPLRSAMLLPIAEENSYDIAQPFTPRFLDLVEPATLLRFAGWQKTEFGNSRPRSWADRPLPHQRQHTVEGVALEHMITLANHAGAAVWFTLPARDGADGDGAGEEYLENFAQLVKDTLDPSLDVYVSFAHGEGFNEWSKAKAMRVLEVWRAVFDDDGEGTANGEGGESDSHTLYHVHETRYLDHVLGHWADDVGELDAIAVSGAVRGPFQSRTLAVEHPGMDSDDVLDLFRSSILDGEQLIHAEMQRAFVQGVDVFAFEAGLAPVVDAFGFRDQLRHAEWCAEHYRFPCTFRYWDTEANNGTGALLDYEMLSETEPLPLSAEYAAEQIEKAPVRYFEEFSVNFASRHVGGLVLPVDGGTYRFSLTCDDHCMLFFNDALVIDHRNAAEVPTWTRSVELSLTGSGPHKLTVEHAQNWGNSGLMLRWSGPGVGDGESTEDVIVPPEAFPEGVSVSWYYEFDTYLDMEGAPAVLDLKNRAPDIDTTAANIDYAWAPPHSHSFAAPAEAAAQRLIAELEDAVSVGLFLEDELDMRANAEAEQSIEDAIREAEARPEMRDLQMDFLERWRHIGGKAIATQHLIHPSPCIGKCGTGLLTNPLADLESDDAAKWRGVRDWIAGEAGGLPFTAADVSPPYLSAATPCSPECEWGICNKQGVCECFAGYSGEGCSVLGAKPNDCVSPLAGINLDGPADWGTELSYVDVFRRGRDWVPHEFNSYEWNTNAPIEINENGYPTRLAPNQKVGSMMMRDLEAHGISGQYVILYDGDGIVTPTMSDVRSFRRVGPGYIEVDLELSTNGNNGLEVVIERTNPDDPVRNIRVVTPGFLDRFEQFPFHPTLLLSLEQVRTVRFMNWQFANSVQIPTWEERLTRDWRSVNMADVHGRTSGVPVEDMVLLANMAGVNPYFSMPYNADDQYIRSFAELVRDTLRPDVEIFIEYGNEPWHTGFYSGQYAQTRGAELELNEEGNAWWGGAATEARLCYVGHRTKEIAQIWDDVFGSHDRLNVVIQGQVGWDITSAKLLSCGDAHTSVDFLGLGPYFGAYDPTNTSQTLDVLLDVDVPASLELMREAIAPHKQAAADYGVGLITYESGYGDTGDGTSSDLSLQAALDPRMEGIYVDYHTMLEEEGFTMMCQFTSISRYTQYGSWGLRYATDQDPREAPKWRGFTGFMDARRLCDAADYCAAPSGEDDGEASLCNDSGHCLPDGTCSCYFRFSGDNCETVEPLHHYDCGYKCTFDQGECVVSEVSGYNVYHSCECAEGYYGRHCGLFNCQDNCNWSGDCIDRDVCSCYRGFRGPFCEEDCGCSGHGRCADDDGEGDVHSCVCDFGYKPSEDGSACVFDCECDECSGPNLCACNNCENGTCMGGECRCWAGFEGDDCTEVAAEGKPNDGSPIGIGLSGLSYWSSQWPFVDVMLSSSRWITNWHSQAVTAENAYRWDRGPEPDIGEDGWPKSLQDGALLGKLMLRDVLLHAPEGVYTVLYDGHGSLKFGMDAEIVSTSAGRVRVRFNPSVNIDCVEQMVHVYCGENGFWMEITAVDESDPIRNIRVIMPGFEETHEAMPFHPLFLKRLDRFSTLRFMDWAGTNHATEVEWSDRPRPGRDLAGTGNMYRVPLEYQILLANTMGANPWFCVPHTASHDYVRSMAEMILASLRSDVDVYVEHSNEVWNQGFPQGVYARERGLELGLSDDAAIAGYRYHAQRTVEILEIFREVFGESGPGGRIKGILSSWGALCGGWCGEIAIPETLSWQDAYQHVDALGVTGYFNCGLGQTNNLVEDLAMDVDDMFAQCEEGKAGFETYSAELVDLVEPFGLPLVAYEGGPGIMEHRAIESGDFDVGLTKKFVEVHRDPRMADLYRDYLDILARVQGFGAGGASMPFMHFGSVGHVSQYGSWNVLEYQDQRASEVPKWLALQARIDEVAGPRVLPGCVRAWLPTASPALGLDDDVLVGPPAVWSPRRGDVHLPGETIKVRWDATRSPRLARAQLRLWRRSNCAELGGHLVAQLGSVANTGYAERVLPDSLSPSNDYFVEVRARWGSNFSEPFRVDAPYVFHVGDWNECSEECGRGVQTRPVDCHATETLLQRLRRRRLAALPAPVPATFESDTYCTLAENCEQNTEVWDSRRKLCHRESGDVWPLTFVIDSAWRSMCWLDERGCRGYRTTSDGPDYGYSNGRQFTDCTQLTSPDACGAEDGCHRWDAAQLSQQDTIVPHRMCTLFSANADSQVPSASAECFDRPCEQFGWQVTAWTDCSASCGGGEKTRDVVCVTSDLSLADEANCPGLKPPSSQVCNQQACDTYEWRTSDFGACRVPGGAQCGDGLRRRDIWCESSRGFRVASNLCDEVSRPSATETCSLGDCADFGWVVGSWSVCSRPCGGGERTRNVTCLAADGGPSPDPSFCAGAEPDRQMLCNTLPCVANTWVVDEWSECSAQCDGGTMTRSVWCTDELGFALPDESCAAASHRPSTESACNTDACTRCDANRCSGRGHCDDETGTCDCDGTAYTGAFCHVPLECASEVIDRDGSCCDSGVLDPSGVCCSGASPALDADGVCCTSGQLDVCGRCDGDAVAIDTSGVCCPGVLTAAGICCPSGVLDACGVCDGDSASCGTRVSVSVVVDDDFSIDDEFSTDFALVAANAETELAALLGVDAGSVTLADMRRAQSFRRRRLQDGTIVVDVQLDVQPLASSTQEESGPLTADEVSALVDAAFTPGGAADESSFVGTASIAAHAICGNDVCEVGELCVSSIDDCCISDCATVVLPCEVPPGSTEECGGAGRGVCLAGSGQCECFTDKGYTGSACGECLPGFIPDASTGDCVSAATLSCGDGLYEVAPATPTSAVVCAVISECSSDQYEVAPPTADSDRECAALTVCGAGEYETVAATAVSDRACSACTMCGDGEFETVPCATDEDAQCATLTSCGDEEFESVAATGSSDRLCTTCTSCSAGEYEASPCNATVDTVCAPVTPCGSAEFETAAATSVSDRACSACTVCGSDEFETVPCAADVDTQCAPLTICGEHEFESGAPTASSDRVCTTCASCGSGEYEASPCNATVDTVCAPVSQCESTEFEAVAPSEASDRVCQPCTTCAADEYRVEPCGATADTVCSAITQCAADQFESRAPTPSSDRECVPVTICGDGEYQSSAPGPRRDRVCSTCTACGDGNIVGRECSAEADALCVAATEEVVVEASIRVSLPPGSIFGIEEGRLRRRLADLPAEVEAALDSAIRTAAGAFGVDPASVAFSMRVVPAENEEDGNVLDITVRVALSGEAAASPERAVAAVHQAVVQGAVAEAIATSTGEAVTVELRAVTLATVADDGTVEVRELDSTAIETTVAGQESGPLPGASPEPVEPRMNLPAIIGPAAGGLLLCGLASWWTVGKIRERRRKRTVFAKMENVEVPVGKG